ncbi:MULTISPECIES: DUF1659 domain-containing protein [Lactobacillaceae]|uniref:DUF1659 domain-containing protein n=1 Tax=Lactobacillus helveticus TaxID=1587 RepID=A0A2X0R731_LACHE|nr:MULTISPECIES: DUF1659 domain-containing protein [Lactobacillaceae]MCT3405520.1 DUF1659 domain-containing protein [Lactobacillus helveticus]MCT3418494.1 DUF1659 domain-containing protein [Lactobacillus helveticus]MCT3420876.1 DUF1659 domain-containing protein [Lactobacillus helveticus]NRO26961.1 hypothetical protein [Lactobacillus helveticus]NRO31296.1 hypothetical protein [Lactobacillus helveticus]
MNFELAEQSIQYTFGNKRYTNGLKSRMIKDVKKDASAADLKKVGQAIAGLQEDSLDGVILVQKQRVIEVAK